MKTTVVIADDLFERARRASAARGVTLRSLVEDGLRLVLDRAEPPSWRLPDRAVGRPGDPNPLEAMSWQDLRDEIYGGR